MNIIEAIKSGKKFRIKTWDEGRYLYIFSFKSSMQDKFIIENDGNYFSGYCYDTLITDDWEVIE
jgi:hypothetical protein